MILWVIWCYTYIHHYVRVQKSYILFLFFYEIIIQNTLIYRRIRIGRDTDKYGIQIKIINNLITINHLKYN